MGIYERQRLSADSFFGDARAARVGRQVRGKKQDDLIVYIYEYDVDGRISDCIWES